MEYYKNKAISGSVIMRIVNNVAWIYYIGDNVDLDSETSGKWMYYFNDKSFVSKICEEAVKRNIVSESKHSNKENGVACFYLNSDDIETHKKIISFFLVNNLIQRTKTGRFYNISFKLDKQTDNGEYGNQFNSEIKLEQFINLNTGEWIV
jgi:hypothetical protein